MVGNVYPFGALFLTLCYSSVSYLQSLQTRASKGQLKWDYARAVFVLSLLAAPGAKVLRRQMGPLLAISGSLRGNFRTAFKTVVWLKLHKEHT